jgi:hypothetical protein
MPSPASRSPHPKRLQLLHVAKRQLGIADDEWRALLSRVAGVVSSADLDDFGFQRVIGELNRLGFRSTSARRNFGHRPGFATPAQINAIRGYWREFHGPDPDDSALNGWLFHYHRVSALRFVSSEKAAKVLPALKQMVARQRASILKGLKSP